ncbi:hypothetical protein [Kistimonas asteriae]|uniref:hypothetical protein n=1 Tax=Kistimonas asteriae TaxID=517724 RepID=UPI001BA96DB2|nr:hypothetical protein [Kistimonas asteriae]
MRNVTRTVTLLASLLFILNLPVQAQAETLCTKGTPRIKVHVTTDWKLRFGGRPVPGIDIEDRLVFTIKKTGYRFNLPDRFHGDPCHRGSVRVSKDGKYIGIFWSENYLASQNGLLALRSEDFGESFKLYWLPNTVFYGRLVKDDNGKSVGRWELGISKITTIDQQSVLKAHNTKHFKKLAPNITQMKSNQLSDSFSSSNHNKISAEMFTVVGRHTEKGEYYEISILNFLQTFNMGKSWHVSADTNHYQHFFSPPSAYHHVWGNDTDKQHLRRFQGLPPEFTAVPYSTMAQCIATYPQGSHDITFETLKAAIEAGESCS